MWTYKIQVKYKIGLVNFKQFLQAAAKLNISVPLEDLQEIFNTYELVDGELLNYKQFAAQLFEHNYQSQYQQSSPISQISQSFNGQDQQQRLNYEDNNDNSVQDNKSVVSQSRSVVSQQRSEVSKRSQHISQAPYGIEYDKKPEPMETDVLSVHSDQYQVSTAAGRPTSKRGQLQYNPINEMPQQQKNISHEQNFENIMQHIRVQIQERGIRGIFQLRKKLWSISESEIGIEDFERVFSELRYALSQEQLCIVFRKFDKQNNYTINYLEFLQHLQQSLNSLRRNYIQQIFRLLDSQQQSYLDLDFIRQNYNNKNHPDIQLGKKNEQEILQDFLDTFETHHMIWNNDPKLQINKVTYEQFKDYYYNVSLTIAEDNYFEFMIKLAWKI